MTYLQKEIRFDSWYHILLSVAVVAKIVFVSSAILCYIEERRNKTETNRFKKIVHIKDISNELTILVVCLLMIYMFNPYNTNFCIDKQFKTLLFAFAIFTIAEIHWIVFTKKVYPDANTLQFFLGRIGTMRGQIERDKVHAEYYDNVSWTE